MSEVTIIKMYGTPPWYKVMKDGYYYGAISRREEGWVEHGTGRMLVGTREVLNTKNRMSVAAKRLVSTPSVTPVVNAPAVYVPKYCGYNPTRIGNKYLGSKSRWKSRR